MLNLSSNAKTLLQLFVAALLCLPVTLTFAMQSSASLRLVPQTGHAGNVLATSISDDGNYMLSGDSRGTLKVWDVTNGWELRSFTAHQGSVASVLMYRDHKTKELFGMSVSHKSKRVRLWNISTGKFVKEVGGKHAPRVLALAPKRSAFYTAGDGKYVYRWGLGGTKPLKRYPALTGGVSALAVSADGGLLAIGGKKGVIHIRKSDGKRRLLNTKAHDQAITALEFSRDGRSLLSAAYDGMVRVWRVADGKVMAEFPHQDAVLSAVFTSDGDYIVTGGKDKRLRFWSVEEQHVRYSRNMSYNIDTLSMVATGRALIVGGRGRHLESIALPGAAGHVDRTYQQRSSVELGIALSREGGRAISYGNANRLSVWDLRRGKLLRMFDAQDTKISAVAISSDGGLAAVGAVKSGLRIWDIVTGEPVGDGFNGIVGPITSVEFASDESSLAASNLDGDVAIWEVGEWDEPQWLNNYKELPQVRYSPDAKRFLVAFGDTLEIRELDTKEIVATLRFPTPVRDVAFLNEDAVVVTDLETQLRYRDINTGKPLHEPVRLGGYNNFVRVSRDGTRVITTCKQSPFVADPIQTLRYWDAGSGKELHAFGNHTVNVEDAEFVGEGERVVSVSDNTLRIWAGEKGSLLALMTGSPEQESMVVTPDNYFNTSHEGGNELVWVASRTLETFTVRQIPKRFRRPDLVKQRLNGVVKDAVTPTRLRRPPRVVIDESGQDAHTDNPWLTLNGTAKGDAPLSELNISVNGRPVISKALRKVSTKWTARMPLNAGVNRIHVSAVDKEGYTSNSSIVDVYSSRSGVKGRKLYVVGVGVNKYVNFEDWELRYASKDAEGFVEMITDTMGRDFDEVEKITLLDSSATRDNIARAFDSLADMGSDDLAMVLLSGHGVIDKSGEYYFLGPDAPRRDKDGEGWGKGALGAAGGFGWSHLSKSLPKIKGRLILFLDSCHSSSLTNAVIAPNDAMASSLFKAGRGGVTIFSASKGRQKSQESARHGHGLFYYKVSEALTNEAKVVDGDGNGSVEFSELVTYVARNVAEQTKGLQTPWLSFQEMYGDIPLVSLGGAK